MPANPCFLSQVTPKQLEKYLDEHPELPGAYYRFVKENYLDKGVREADVLIAAAADLNIPKSHLARIIDRPKSVRPYREAQFEAARSRRDFLRYNESYVRNLNSTYLGKAFDLFYKIPMSSLLFQHGGTGAAIHAQPYLQQVNKMHRWLNAAKRQFQGITSNQHDAIMAEIEKDPQFKYLRDVAGLDLHVKDTPRGWRAAFGWNARAWNVALNPLRLYDAKAKLKFWGRRLQGKDYDFLAKEIAGFVNHSTGTMSPGEGIKIPGKLAIAPTLMQASWYKGLFDLSKTGRTYYRMFESSSKLNPNVYVSAGERRANHMRAVNQAAWLSTIASSLVVNQAFLQATGSKQRINFGWGPGGDFTKSDLWRLKAFGYVIRPRGGFEIMALIARMIAMGASGRYHGKTPEERIQQTIGQYAEYKAHPFLSSGLELLTGETLYGERVPKEMEDLLPWLRGKQHPRGQTQLPWGEYVSQHLPIFIGGAAHEYYAALREQGMDVNDINALFRGLSDPKNWGPAAITGFSEFLGFGIYKERPPSPPRRSGKAASFYSG